MKRISIFLASLVLGAWLVASEATAAANLPAGYLTSVRPDPPGTATPVSIGLTVVDISNISDIEQSFKADFYFTIRWQDPRLTDPDMEADRVFPLGDIWNPQLGIINRRDIDIVLPDVVRVDPSGAAVFSQRVYGDFYAPLDLREFPSDSQILPIKIISYWYGPDELDLSSDSRTTGTLENFSVAGWTILSSDIDFSPERVSTEATRRAQVSWQITAERESAYYRYNLLVPLILISLMAWCVFWIDPTYLPSQIAISTSSVFTVIAFRFSLRLFLPRISYMTKADLFILGMTALVFYALAQAVSTGWLAKNGREPLARSMDRWGRWIYLACVIVLVFVTMRI